MENKNVFTYFIECITKNYANFSGRARRKEYWSFVLVNFLIGIVLQVLTISTETIAFSLVSTIINFALLIPSLAVAVRRMHDCDKSGWFILVPIYNLILSLTGGTTGPNRYGNDPKNPDFGNEIGEIGLE